ncbi:MAG: ribulose-phosphate 3-epimerase [Pseudomonadota bacterium]
MTLPAVIAPSILAADLARLGEECNQVINAGADWIHFDVMDNHYVPNLTFGPSICSSLRKFGIDAPIDVHLMVEPVDALIVDFAKAGASMITFHPEASKHIDRSLQLILDHGCQAGLVLNPATPLSVLDYVIEKLDMVLLMSVNPGFGGQKFIQGMKHKAQQTRELLDRIDKPIRLQIDGGVTVKNIAEIAQSGVDTFVAGSAIFNSDNYQTTIDAMRTALADSTI